MIQISEELLRKYTISAHCVEQTCAAGLSRQTCRELTCYSTDQEDASEDRRSYLLSDIICSVVRVRIVERRMHEVSEVSYYQEDRAAYEQCQYDRSWDVLCRVDSILRVCSQRVEPEEAVACSCSSGYRVAEIDVRVVER